MTKLLALLVGLFVLASPAYAANVATAQAALPGRVGVYSGPIIPYVVTLDTTASDVTVRTPDSDKMVCLVGANWAEASAANVTWKSGSTTLVTWELPANASVGQELGNGAVLCSGVGQALKFQVSVVISTMLLYVIETANFDLSGR